MHSDRKQIIAQTFGQKSDEYDHHATLQKDIAAHLASLLPQLETGAKILEIGCGTGFLTHHLINLYPDAKLSITDISPDMVKRCRTGAANHPHIEFQIMDGENPPLQDNYDLIVSSMAVQWFENAEEGLARLQTQLTATGQLFFSTIGANSFPEWRASLLATATPSGLLDGMSTTPYLIEKHHPQVQYKNALAFLRAMKSIGAHNPKSGYKAQSPAQIRRACRHFDDEYSGLITWQILYGSMKAP